ncbi:hypothetical protein [Shewanella salipaludis]|uniref:Uncharacterized protein n=1 Tax=Shewanella salipaludis TaxID=2723052 RepID=A0A972G2D4_9GAMM|nr:hypothetical protein [Shewanella salipaludis]NMH65939.1 hypothetical protein [Shewanella salipaludis]
MNTKEMEAQDLRNKILDEIDDLTQQLASLADRGLLDSTEADKIRKEILDREKILGDIRPYFPASTSR